MKIRTNLVGRFVVALLMLSSLAACNALKHLGEGSHCNACKEATPSGARSCDGNLECRQAITGSYICFAPNESTCTAVP